MVCQAIGCDVAIVKSYFITIELVVNCMVELCDDCARRAGLTRSCK